MTPSKTSPLQQLRLLELVLQSAQERVASPAQPPPPQSWLDIAGHLGRFLSAATHLFERMMAATSTARQDALPAAVMTEATGALDLPAISGAAAMLHSSAISGNRPTPQQQPPRWKSFPSSDSCRRGRRPDFSAGGPRHPAHLNLKDWPAVAASATEPAVDEQAWPPSPGERREGALACGHQHGNGAPG
ncbi:unnamed protein product [Lampetra fluviatilis]